MLQVLRWHGWNLASFTHRTALRCGGGHLHLRHCLSALEFPNDRPFRGGNPPSNSQVLAIQPFDFKDDFPKVLEVWSPTKETKGWFCEDLGIGGKKVGEEGGVQEREFRLHSLKVRGFESISRTLLVGGFKHFLCSHPTRGNDPIWPYFSTGWLNHQLVSDLNRNTWDPARIDIDDSADENRWCQSVGAGIVTTALNKTGSLVLCSPNICLLYKGCGDTIPKTNITPKNAGFQEESPFQGVYVQGLC